MQQKDINMLKHIYYDYLILELMVKNFKYLLVQIEKTVAIILK